MSDMYDRTVELAKQGVRPADIADRLELHPHTVYGQLRKARERGEEIPRFPPGGYGKRSVPLNTVLRNLLLPHANKRGLTLVELASLILDRVVEDNLVDAVLDDANGGADV